MVCKVDVVKSDFPFLPFSTNRCTSKIDLILKFLKLLGWPLSILFFAYLHNLNLIKKQICLQNYSITWFFLF